MVDLVLHLCAMLHVDVLASCFVIMDVGNSCHIGVGVNNCINLIIKSSFMIN